jgi:tRNA nucleotidyltransferase (CCA-adding enzyme)
MEPVELAPPRAVREIAERLQRAGHEAWAVGGAVRDALIGRGGGDWDLATSATPTEMRQIFRRTVPIGVEHGTVGVLERDGVLYEVTTFRRDVETDGRHAVVAFARTLEEDLARRDFTFNAVAWNPLTAEVRDPYGGLDDLRAGRLRTVGAAHERFAEDYLRVLRALRFAGHFVLRIEPDVETAIRDAVPNLGRLSAERVREELWKVLSKTHHASATLELYRTTGVLAALLPELDATSGIESGDGGSAWLRALAAVDALPPTRLLLRVAALLHAVGMPQARVRDLRGGWRYVGHEQLGARTAEEIMRRMKASNADTDRVATLVARQSDLFPPDAEDRTVRRWLLHVGATYVRDFFRLRIALLRADAALAGDAPHGRPPGAQDVVERWRKAHRVMRAQPVLDVRGLAIDGTDLKALGMRPGPEFGRILDALLDRVIDEPSLNERDTLLEIVREEHAQP